MAEEDENWKIQIVDAEAEVEEIEEETIEEDASDDAPLRNNEKGSSATKMYRDCRFLLAFYMSSIIIILGLAVGCLIVSLDDDGAGDFQVHSAIQTICSMTNHISEEFLLYTKEQVGVPFDAQDLHLHMKKTDQYVSTLSKGVGYNGKVKELLQLNLINFSDDLSEMRKLKSDFPLERMGSVLKMITSLVLRLLVLTQDNGDTQLRNINSVLLLELYTMAGSEEVASSVLHDPSLNPDLFDFTINEQVLAREMQAVIIDFLEPLGEDDFKNVIESYHSVQGVLDKTLSYLEPLDIDRSHATPESLCAAVDDVNDHFLEEAAELQTLTDSVVADRDRDYQRRASVWITCCSFIVLMFLFSGLIIKEYHRRTSTEATIKKDFDPTVDFNEMVSTYCDRICDWKLHNIPIHGSPGEMGQIELQLCKAVSALGYLLPFVPPWLFTTDIPLAITLPYSADQAPLAEEELLRNESCSTNSESWRADQQDSIVCNRTKTENLHISLKLGLESTDMVLVWISNRSLNLIDTLVPDESNIPILESCCEVYLQLLMDVAADHHAKLLSINSLYCLFGYHIESTSPAPQSTSNQGDSLSMSQSNSKSYSPHIKACHFALKLLDRYDAEVKNHPTLRSGMGDPENGFPHISISSGCVKAGVVTTGTFKTYIVLGSLVPFGLSVLLMNKSLGTRVLINQSTRNALKDEKSVYSVQCGVMGTNVVSELLWPQKSDPDTRAQRSLMRQFFLSFKRRKWRHADKVLNEYVQTYEGDNEKEVLLDTRKSTSNLKIAIRRILSDKIHLVGSESSSVQFGMQNDMI